MTHHHLTVILIVMYAQSLPAAEQPQPEVWMAALYLPRDFAERENEWRDVLRGVDGFKFWSGQLDWNENGTPGNLMRLLHAQHVDIVSERMYWPPLKAEGQSDISHGAAGPLDDTIGERAALLDLYQQRGGRPNRYIVQSWYAHPTADEVLPETNPNTLTGLVRAVIERVKPSTKP